MNINIIAVGKLKEKYLKEAVSEYSKRLSKYCRLDIIEVSDEKAPENMSQAEEVAVKEREGQAILKHVKSDTYVIALAIEGKMLSSEALADFINDLGIKGRSNIAFIIGGSLGLSDEVLKRADFKLSFSPMTFPHQLMRVILLEQIYRGYRINMGER
ncbi:23S rRNA (pseudouridine(1915)-N(3))-methyltransferase RlmH [Lutispora saccharofermentans]|uniref:Ribosomal RNA large subunit methyltransferase H n=1 Tax=Lutispora saccharofermentans TaxID=3024236 RepID=A0ABT1NJM5_9FIRM|nr:23S rRNA (pseudouridine(1915)-N(3))-methyltransferase RlmH [Lutispora saccharofermentans]MCQ1531397.1 23S rRNA (pseudouridine(1915)-N(3))-methyltransferase RlmH [Lutispora saccharofermentans]